MYFSFFFAPTHPTLLIMKLAPTVHEAVVECMRLIYNGKHVIFVSIPRRMGGSTFLKILASLMTTEETDYTYLLQSGTARARLQFMVTDHLGALEDGEVAAPVIKQIREDDRLPVLMVCDHFYPSMHISDAKNPKNAQLGENKVPFVAICLNHNTAIEMASMFAHGAVVRPSDAAIERTYEGQLDEVSLLSLWQEIANQ